MEGISSQRFVSPIVETARIVNVNIKDWTVDVVSEHGDKKFFDIQVMSPYFHPSNGEGIYVVPEVGALVWVCKPSDGSFSAPFVLGFQAPYDQSEEGFRDNRMSLNPGDMMFRTRDENFLILRRGGIVQIGATPMSQRIFIPIRNIIRDFCENYELNSMAGNMFWTVDRDDTTTTGDAPTRFSLRVKNKATDTGFIASITAGSHGEAEPTKLLIEVKETGDESSVTKISLKLTKDGDVTWEIGRDMTLHVSGKMESNVDGDRTSVVGGKESVESTGDMTLHTHQNLSIKASLAAVIEALGGDATVKSPMNVNLQGTKVNLGGPSAVEPVVKGTQLAALLTNLIGQISSFQCPSAAILTGAPLPVIAAPAVATLTGQVPTILSNTSFTV